MDKYIPLKTVVYLALDAAGKSIKDADKCWLLAFRALKLLNQSIAAQPTSVRLPVSGNKTVVLPNDYIAWSKIGVLNSNGEVCSLKVNRGLSLLKGNNPDRLTYLNGDISDGFSGIENTPYYFNFYNNGVCMNLYGVKDSGLITYGDCRVDENNGIIILDPNFQYPSIILEYISNPETVEGDYQVEGCLQEAIIAFIEWKLKIGTRQDFYAAAVEGRRSLSGKRVTLQSINQVVREGTGMILKN